ncbi:stage IV sporulation protein FB [Bacillus ginsengihumi]|nr:M50 family metallopeptidase [Heyndrickxia ginsengihumi]MBE6184150.1 stage IV sporulation protein FB [Bacillus sp. (in: firmicutes)]MCM3021877.1 M50 family metallopeptidase [Heyndrickxia ginsengihumi]NEY20436.1 stage IV sporulation protein FB [Heyndrickxia ginsengihumi]
MKIRIHPLFWLIAGISILTARFQELLILFSIIFIHEMGHGIMAHFFSWRIKKILLLPFGGVAEMDEHGNRPFKEELLVVLAGPLQHVWIACLAVLLYHGHLIEVDQYEMMMGWNMMILLFNLLPIWPLDGGKLINLLFSRKYPFLNAFRMTIVSSIVFLIVFHCISLILTPFNINIWAIVLYLYVALWKEWKQLYYVFMRFLLERYYGKKRILKGLTPLKVDGNTYLYEVLEKFKRDCKHPLIVVEKGEKIGELDENELLFAYFAEKQTNAKVKDILYSYE